MADKTTSNRNEGDGAFVAGNVSAGGDIVFGNQTINQILQDDTITNEATLVAYLKKAAEKATPPADVPERAKAHIERLWKIPFFGHLSDESSIHTTPLWPLVRDRFEVAQKSELPQVILLMANAGMGKTGALSILMDARARLTLVNRAKAESTKTDFSADRTFIIPIVLDLEELIDTDLSINDLISDSIKKIVSGERVDDYNPITKSEVEDFLEQFSCMFLVDNLDLILMKSETDLLKLVRQFIQNNQGHQFVVACRPTLYRGQLGRYDRIYLHELRNKDVRKVLKGSKYERLRGPIRSLARNRSHLEMILEAPTGRRSEGYPPISKGHLVQYAEQKKLDSIFSADGDGGRHIDIEVAEEVLRRLAFEMSKSAHGTCSDMQAKAIVTDFLQQWNEPYSWRKVMNELRGAKLLKRSGRRNWIFANRKTESYFAAAYLTENFNLIDGNLDQLVMPRGNETLEILTGLISKPDHLIDKLMDDGHVFTAAHCGQFAADDLEPSTIDKLFRGLMDVMKGEHSTRRVEVALLLGESGHSGAIRALVHLLVKEHSSLVVKAIALALWACVLQNDYEEFDKILHREVRALEHSAYFEAEELPDPDLLLEVLHVFDPTGHSEVDLAAQYERLIYLVQYPESHRLIRGLAGFGLGLMADSRMQSIRNDEESATDSEKIDELLETARQKLLEFMEVGYGEKSADNLFVAWCCADALTKIDHNQVLTTSIRMVKAHKSCEENADPQTRAQAIYIIGLLGRRTAHKHELAAKTLVDLLNEEFSPFNIKSFGYAAQAVARLWIEAPKLAEDHDEDDPQQPEAPQDTDTVRRMNAAQNLFACRDKLEEIMDDTNDSWLQRKISEALGEIGTKDALDLLNQQLDREESRIRSLQRAIERLNERINE